MSNHSLRLPLVLLVSLSFTGVSFADAYPKAAQEAFLEACTRGGAEAAACQCVLEALEQNVAFESLAESYDAEAVDAWTVECHKATVPSTPGAEAPEKPEGEGPIQTPPEEEGEAPQATITLDPSQRPGSFNTLQSHFVGWVQVDGLPAVSMDGKHVAVAHVAEDGVRQHPNMTVQIFEVGSTAPPIFEQVVLDVEEARDFKPKDAKTIESRIEKISTKLAQYRWRPLAQLELIDGKREGPQLASDGSAFTGPFMYPGQNGALTVTFVESRLAATGQGGSELYSGAFETPGPTPDCIDLGTCDCTYESYFKAAHADLKRGVLMVTIGYIGADSLCIEPNSNIYAVPLKRSL